MSQRTDLALEKSEKAGKVPGIDLEEEIKNGVTVTRIRVTDRAGELTVGKPAGNYITVEADNFGGETDGDCREIITEELSRLIPKEGTVLVTGLGNYDITPDALGPKTADRIFATRHIDGETAKEIGLERLRPVCVLSPGVLGKTGIETAEIIRAVAEKIKPSAVVAVDALAAMEPVRLGKTVQLSDTGICPGSGVGNSRSELSKKSLGIPVIAVGVPTVVDMATLAEGLAGEQGAARLDCCCEMMVTPREIDAVIDRAADLVALSLNCALQPQLSPKELSALV